MARHFERSASNRCTHEFAYKIIPLGNTKGAAVAQSNVERVGKALELFNLGVQPYVEREMKAVCGARWMDPDRR